MRSDGEENHNDRESWFPRYHVLFNETGGQVSASFFAFRGR